MTQTVANLYEIYQKRHDELLHIAQSQYELVQALGMDMVQNDGTKHGEVLSGLIDRLNTDKLRVLVIGCFSSGKSTFINALFGQNILPASPTPTTGVLCEIKFATDSGKKAILYPKNGMGKGGDDAPFEVMIENIHEELGKYVKIDHFGNTQKTSRYQKLELYWPLPMLQHGIELIDSVGLDDPDSRDEITLNYAKSVDAILYCINSGRPYSAKDKQVLIMLKSSLGYESIFFILTHYDAVQQSVNRGEMTEDEFRRIQLDNLTSCSGLKENGIQYIDSRLALDGSIQKNEEMVASSGIREIKSVLETFLVEEKGRAKLLTTLRALRSTNRAVRQIIPARRSMWQASTEELEKRYRDAEQPLKNLEARRQLMVGGVSQHIGDIARDAYDMADGFFMSLPDKIVQWANEYEIEASVFPPTKSTLKPVVEEVIEHIKACIEKETANWNHEELAPMIGSRMSEIQESLEQEANDFIKQADEIRVHISIGDQIDNDAVAEQEKPSMVGRLIAGGFALLTGDFITGGLGAFLGIKAMLTTLVYEIIAGVIVGIASMFTPVGLGALIGAGISAVVVGGVHNVLSIKSHIKKSIGEKISEEIGKKRKQLSKDVENKVKEELFKIKTALDNGLAGEISSIRGEVEAILDESRKGKSNSERNIKALDILEEKNIALEESIDKLIFEANMK